MRHPIQIALAACSFLVLVPSCAKKAKEASQEVHVPGEDATIDDYEAMLDTNEKALREFGISLASGDSGGGDAAPEAAGAADEGPASSGDFNKAECGALCDLSAATCDLQARICVLKERHTDEPRYAAACTRATPGRTCR